MYELGNPNRRNQIEVGQLVLNRRQASRYRKVNDLDKTSASSLIIVECVIPVWNRASTSAYLKWGSIDRAQGDDYQLFIYSPGLAGNQCLPTAHCDTVCELILQIRFDSHVCT
ncbi:hypothetical protein J6590_058598 [Homalodisca vitripennis]|nr:hypothetical protein J6590_058598 [Homalodisca vitripennis]